MNFREKIVNIGGKHAAFKNYTSNEDNILSGLFLFKQQNLHF